MSCTSMIDVTEDAEHKTIQRESDGTGWKPNNALELKAFLTPSRI